jgi:nitrate reductase molybdenum cofactor assembly chaperone NarJ/NarW
MRTYKALGALLSYPDASLVASIGEIRAVLDAERLVTGADRRALDPLLDEIAAGDLFDLQERYVLLFDRTRSLSLHLFEHVHGESRERGPAMIELRELYLARGMALETSELPDFLPVFLEFLASLPAAEARALLAEPAHILAAIEARLVKRGSAYAAVFRALVALAKAKDADAARRAAADEPVEDPNDRAALDRAWEEAAVLFGPGAEPGKDGAGAADCAKAGAIARRLDDLTRREGDRP